ncbi:MAG: ABC transporter permease [Terriglobia bacterium]|jgi:ABC-type transport system involved in multi-copper enzyme maturation permease subunit
MGRIAIIALGAFKESVRERVLYNLIVFAFLMIAAAILLGSISVGVERIILVNFGLAAISFFGFLMAIFIGIGLVSKEIERRTIYNILSKPVSRAEFILGKYAGLLLTLLVNTAIMTAGFYLALAFQKGGLTLNDLSLLLAVYFILLQFAIIVGVAIFFSCLSTPILSAVFTLCLLVIGNLSGDMRRFGQESGSPWLEKVTAALYYLLPNFSNFNVITPAAHGVRISGLLIAANTCYAILYIAVLVSGSILIFEEREFR